jgi:hypothetical protein
MRRVRDDFFCHQAVNYSIECIGQGAGVVEVEAMTYGVLNSIDHVGCIGPHYPMILISLGLGIKKAAALTTSSRLVNTLLHNPIR